MSRRAVGGALLAVLLLAAVPPFACLELHSDVILFDVYARTLQRGGVPYRDSCETNLPGMTWLHWVAHSAFGWRSETLRIVDLALVGSIVVLLCGWYRDISFAGRLVLGLALGVFYLTQTEWCHVQRDPWMLLPALAAMYLRRRGRYAFLEGLLWAAAFWVKPFVAVPGLFVWLSAARLARRDGMPDRRILLDGAALLAGGVLAGGLGVAWLVRFGAWPHFVEMATVWNREYFDYDVTAGQRGLLMAGFAVRFFPWLLIHVVAVPVAVRQLIRSDRSIALLAALYLGWLLQAVFLQHLFDYVQVPPLLLGVVVVAGQVAAQPGQRRPFAAFLLVCVFCRVPVLIDRLEGWPDCWRAGSSPAVRDRLSSLHKVKWQELARVADYLRRREVGNGELTCFNMPTAALYRELDVEAATRYHFFQNNWLTFRRQRPRIHADLVASRQRFVVVDLCWEGTGLPADQLDAPLPPGWNRWQDRIVFRAERYAVLELTGAETVEWLTDCFGDR